MALSEADVQDALARVVDPNTGKDFVATPAQKLWRSPATIENPVMPARCTAS